MNKAFKIVWSEVRRAFVTTDEAHKAHGKATKSVATIVATAALIGGASSSRLR